MSATLSGLTANTQYYYRVGAQSSNPTKTYGSGLTFSTTPVVNPPPTSLTLTYPTGVTVVGGSAPSGNATNLSGVDGSYYSLRSPFLGSPSWYGTFGVAANASDFKVTYTGNSTRTCTLSLAIYRWTTNTWVAAGSSVSVGTSAVTVSNAAPAASVNAADLRSAAGVVRVRASCSAGFSFSTYTLNSDMLQLSYRS